MTALRALFTTLRALVGGLLQRRLGVLLPLVLLLTALGGLFALAAAAPALSPFVYLLF
jgi:hypothetical protein